MCVLEPTYQDTKYRIGNKEIKLPCGRGKAENARERGAERAARWQSCEAARAPSGGGTERRTKRRTTRSEHGDGASADGEAVGESKGAARSDNGSGGQ